MGAEIPHAMTEAEIKQVIDDYGKATHRAIKAGFDGIELHGANTYLLQQFVSPHSNRRSDKWGGSFENRIRFPLAVIQKVREIINTYADLPFLLGYRISPEEYETPGIRLADTLNFIKVLNKSSIDYLHVSMELVWQTSINDKNNKVPIIKQIQDATQKNLPLIGVGGIEYPDEAEAVIQSGIEFTAMGREFVREPKWVQKVEANDEASIHHSISPADFDELAIPAVMQDYLISNFFDEMHFTITSEKACE